MEGYGREEQKEFVFCEVETDDGLTGIAITGHFLARSVVTALKLYVLPTVRDMDVRDLEAIHQKVFQKLNPRAMTGVVSSALSCLDIASVGYSWKGHEPLGGPDAGQRAHFSSRVRDLRISAIRSRATGGGRKTANFQRFFRAENCRGRG